jgi:hypothetical protein
MESLKCNNYVKPNFGPAIPKQNNYMAAHMNVKRGLRIIWQPEVLPLLSFGLIRLG